ncbi:MAG TPA: hypothetical protein VFE27_17290 [Acidobacteriaceae bacterium]|jgi:hypothetical protein|nr:hypothetical protein [Acidobacteriaceae bacterium]
MQASIIVQVVRYSLCSGAELGLHGIVRLRQNPIYRSYHAYNLLLRYFHSSADHVIDPTSMFSSDANTIVVGVWMLQEGEEMIVAKRLHEILMNAIKT